MKTPHAQFIDGYCLLYEQHFGGPYLFHGGKDGSAVKRLLAAKVLVTDALEMVRDAFTRTGFPWDNAVTIASFVSAWPRLVAERAKRRNPTVQRPLTRWDLQRQIDLVKEQISSHPHNPESVHEDRSVVVEVPLEQWRRKLEELKRAYALL